MDGQKGNTEPPNRVASQVRQLAVTVLKNLLPGAAENDGRIVQGLQLAILQDWFVFLWSLWGEVAFFKGILLFSVFFFHLFFGICFPFCPLLPFLCWCLQASVRMTKNKTWTCSFWVWGKDFVLRTSKKQSTYLVPQAIGDDSEWDDRA